MTSVVDLWRAIDAEAILVSGAVSELARPVRGVQRTRALAPHLPAASEGWVLVVDLVAMRVSSLAELLGALHDARLAPVALMLAGTRGSAPDAADSPMPVLASSRGVAQLLAEATAYLADEPAALERLSGALRLACAEAALAEPELATPSGLIAARMGRGVAVAVDGELMALHPRPAGRALAARFAALHARLLGVDRPGRRSGIRHAREGLWLIERRARPGAVAWLFDDLPLAAVDDVAADALALTVRALLHRSSRPPATAPPTASRRAADLATGVDPLDATLLAVARCNGRVAPAARLLGVHRNTVLYRLRRALHERGIDPRRPDDALRILAAAEPGRSPSR